MYSGGKIVKLSSRAPLTAIASVGVRRSATTGVHNAQVNTCLTVRKSRTAGIFMNTLLFCNCNVVFRNRHRNRQGGFSVALVMHCHRHHCGTVYRFTGTYRLFKCTEEIIFGRRAVIGNGIADCRTQIRHCKSALVAARGVGLYGCHTRGNHRRFRILHRHRLRCRGRTVVLGLRHGDIDRER